MWAGGVQCGGGGDTRGVGGKVGVIASAAAWGDSRPAVAVMTAVMVAAGSRGGEEQLQGEQVEQQQRGQQQEHDNNSRNQVV